MNNEQHGKLRQRLMVFFNNRNPQLADELADETIFRLIKQLKAGLGIPPGEFEAYSVGIAKNVWLECLRRSPLNSAEPIESADSQPIEIVSRNTEALSRLESEAIRKCVNNCLGRLKADDRLLILEYFKDNWNEQKESRKRLSRQFGLESSSLTNKAWSILRKLNKCVKECLGEK